DYYCAIWHASGPVFF
nr:immunoglobulin light chain junction region [Macaca mulatta]